MKTGIAPEELPGVQGWLSGILWDIRHGYSGHAGATLIALIKAIQLRSGVESDPFEGWPQEAVSKIAPYAFNKGK